MNRWFSMGLVGLIALALALPAGAVTRNWDAGSGWWDTASNWDPAGHPRANDRIYMDQNDATNRLVRYWSDYPDEVLYSVEVNATWTGTMTFQMGSGFTLKSRYMTIGDNGLGIVNSTWGSLEIQDDLILGGRGLDGSVGRLTLSSDGDLIVKKRAFVGEEGGEDGNPSYIDQTATDADIYMLHVGYMGWGEYRLHSGTLDTDSCYVGSEGGHGLFTQNGGTHTISSSALPAPELTIGSSFISKSWGKYVINAGTLDVDGKIDIGDTGNGWLEINGGTVRAEEIDAGQEMHFGDGTVTVTGGLLDVRDGSIDIGISANGDFNHSGGLVIADDFNIWANGEFASTGNSNRLRVNHLTLWGIANPSFAGDLEIGHKGGSGHGEYTIEAGTNLSVGDNFVVGYNDRGDFTQNGGSTTVTDATIVGYLSDAAWGVMEINGGTFTTRDMTVGSWGIGAMTVNDGTVATNGGNLYIGYYSGSIGAVTIEGGTLDVRDDDIRVGRTSGGSTAIFNLNGGLTIADTFSIRSGGILDTDGTASTMRVNEFEGLPDTMVFPGRLQFGHGGGSASGSHAVGAGEKLTVGQELTVGYSEPATFTQSGGEVDPQRHLILGQEAGGDGTYNLHGGRLGFFTIPLVYNVQEIGYYGDGEFNHTGGENYAYAGIGIGHYAGADGYYNLSGTGQLVANALYVGREGYGKFTQNGGACNVGDLRIAPDPTTEGAFYELHSGTLTATTATQVGYRSTGSFLQTGGLHDTKRLKIGHNYATGDGAYTMNGGELVAEELTIGIVGAGRLRLMNPANQVKVEEVIAIGPGGAIEAVLGTTIEMTGSHFENTSTNEGNLAGLEHIEFEYLSAGPSVDLFEVAGVDMGHVEAGFNNNAMVGTWTLKGDASMRMVDNSDNQPGEVEAQYLDYLNLHAGATLDLNGLNLYIRHAPRIDGTLIESGGEWWMVPVLGDFDGNGVVNGLDIPGFKAALADPEGWAAAHHCDPDQVGDFDGNGAFNGLDIPGFKDALAGSSIPEPVTVGMVAVGLIALIRRRA